MKYSVWFRLASIKYTQSEIDRYGSIGLEDIGIYKTLFKTEYNRSSSGGIMMYKLLVSIGLVGVKPFRT